MISKNDPLTPSPKGQIRVLFVCLGNICRSPMAEFIMKDIIEKEGLSQGFLIESAATSFEECGNSVYPPAVRELAKHGISCSGKRARTMTKSDYEKYDYIIGMEDRNTSNILRIIGSDPENKVHKLMTFAGSDENIADPWYTGDFEGVFAQISAGCRGFLKSIDV
ncbi:MAG: low molecular weight phosphotyrosine protein phosphatase [Lachnospiraceae bacterium]|nr:low molecular weight phosphotyrosine protein phosphatase [Lachnospiraceae bacterium]